MNKKQLAVIEWKFARQSVKAHRFNQLLNALEQYRS
jgi:hypothetical protein